MFNSLLSLHNQFNIFKCLLSSFVKIIMTDARSNERNGWHLVRATVDWNALFVLNDNLNTKDMLNLSM